jgi:hypothetical protein
MVSANISRINYLLKMPPDTQLLCLNCFVDGDHQTFTVEVPKIKNVSILKDLIKEKRSHRLENVDASDLDLILVSELCSSTILLPGSRQLMVPH